MAAAPQSSMILEDAVADPPTLGRSTFHPEDAVADPPTFRRSTSLVALNDDVLQIEKNWSNSHVLMWLLDKEFKVFLQAFQYAGVNGALLLKMTREELDAIVDEAAKASPCNDSQKKALLESISRLKRDSRKVDGDMEARAIADATDEQAAKKGNNSPPTLKGWRQVVRTNALCHKFLARRYRDRSTYLTVLLVTLNAVCGSAIFSSAGTESREGQLSPSVVLAFVAGILAMVTAVVSAVKSALAWDVRSEQHRQSALRYAKLWTRFDDMHGLMKLDYLEGYNKKHPLWLDWYKDYLDVMEFAPFVADTVWDQFSAQISLFESRKDASSHRRRASSAVQPK